jgi:hypothetical protein
MRKATETIGGVVRSSGRPGLNGRGAFELAFNCFAGANLGHPSYLGLGRLIHCCRNAGTAKTTRSIVILRTIWGLGRPFI